MINLVAAKCPQCGADIDVNPELEKSICQFCGSTILIQDAIQRVKVEHTGTIKIDGIQGEEDILEIAKKHYAVGEIQKALCSIEDILEVNPYNIGALMLFFEIWAVDLRDYANLSNEEFSKTDMMTEPPAYYYVFKDRLEKVETLDTNHQYSDKIGEYKNLIATIESKIAGSQHIKDMRDMEEARLDGLSREICYYLDECAEKGDSSANRLMRAYGFSRGDCDFNNTWVYAVAIDSIDEDTVRYRWTTDGEYHNTSRTAKKKIPLDEKYKMYKKAKTIRLIIKIVYLVAMTIFSYVAATITEKNEEWYWVYVAAIIYCIVLYFATKLFKKFILKYILRPLY